jgi:predicted Fe-Mo cluster-binding NifX family protein
VKAAFTVWDGRMSPVFDVSREALVLTIESQVVVARSNEMIDTHLPEQKLDRLAALEIDTLICGAISAPLQYELTARGVRVIGFVAGEIDKVVSCFLAGSLPNRALSMPGCCGKRRRYRGGSSRGCRGARAAGREPSDRSE